MGEKTDLKDCCACCPETTCINLFIHDKKDSESIGGELYLYKRLNHSWIKNENLEKHVCANGRLLDCACSIVEAAHEQQKEDYLTKICIEILRDMKASLYLALSGHYRQAILIQRCVFENFLYGLYFHAELYSFSKNDDDKTQVHGNFMSWINGGFPKSDAYLRDIIERGGIIGKAENKEWGTLFNQLSKFVHTIRHTPTGESITCGKAEPCGCEAVLEFDKNNLIEWSEYYQKLFFLILYELLILYPSIKKDKDVKQALQDIRTEFKGIKGELNNHYLDELLKMRGGKSNIEMKQ